MHAKVLKKNATGIVVPAAKLKTIGSFSPFHRTSGRRKRSPSMGSYRINARKSPPFSEKANIRLSSWNARISKQCGLTIRELSARCSAKQFSPRVSWKPLMTACTRQSDIASESHGALGSCASLGNVDEVFEEDAYPHVIAPRNPDVRIRLVSSCSRHSFYCRSACGYAPSLRRAEKKNSALGSQHSAPKADSQGSGLYLVTLFVSPLPGLCSALYLPGTCPSAP